MFLKTDTGQNIHDIVIRFRHIPNDADVFFHGKGRHDVVKLKHKSHVGGAKLCQLFSTHGSDVLIPDPDAAAGWGVHSSQQIQQCALAGAGRTQHNDELTFIHGQIDVIQCVKHFLSVAISAGDLL